MMSFHEAYNSFYEQWCIRCERDRVVWSCWDEKKLRYTQEPEWEKSCPILINALCHRTNDREFPMEFQYCLDIPFCTAFIDKDDPKVAWKAASRYQGLSVVK